MSDKITVDMLVPSKLYDKVCRRVADFQLSYVSRPTHLVLWEGYKPFLAMFEKYELRWFSMEVIWTVRDECVEVF